MAIQTQFAPQPQFDAQLAAVGASKTIYALVMPETEAAKEAVLGNRIAAGPDAQRAAYLAAFREAWTRKQDDADRSFFTTWLDWSAPLVELDPQAFPFRYPTAGASEPLYHLIADYGNNARYNHFVPRLHTFAGEYEGYKAYAEACAITVVEHDRRNWRDVAGKMRENDLFFLSQPSAIDGNIWRDANAFLRSLSAASIKPRVVMDITYVGAVPAAPPERFALNEPAVRDVVFSLSKPFGVYYDRIGGVLCRQQNPGLYGNVWFKNLTSLALGKELMQRHDVFELPRKYQSLQRAMAERADAALGFTLQPADVLMMAISHEAPDGGLASYLRRPAHDPYAPVRLCLTPGMAGMIGTTGPVRRNPPRSGATPQLDPA